MANICYNYLTIEATNKEDILKLILKDNLLSFNILMPMPTDVKILTCPETNKLYTGERHWAWINIGAPGVPNDTEIYLVDDITVISFTSEWTPPYLWFGVLCNVIRANDDGKHAINLELEYAMYYSEMAGITRYNYNNIDGENYVDRIYDGEELHAILGRSIDSPGT